MRRAGADAARIAQLRERWIERGGGLDTILLEEGVVDEATLQPLLEERWQIRNRLPPWTLPAREALALVSAIRAMASRIGGIDMRPSMIRMMMPSAQRTVPETSPTARPAMEAKNATAKPTVRETRAP